MKKKNGCGEHQSLGNGSSWRRISHSWVHSSQVEVRKKIKNLFSDFALSCDNRCCRCSQRKVLMKRRLSNKWIKFRTTVKLNHFGTERNCKSLSRIKNHIDMYVGLSNINQMIKLLVIKLSNFPFALDDFFLLKI